LRRQSTCPPITIEAADLPEDVLALIETHLVSLDGVYGDLEAGDPIQFAELRIEHERGAVEVTVHNRVIPLFT
jgi:hypothetical protein